MAKTCHYEFEAFPTAMDGAFLVIPKNLKTKLTKKRYFQPKKEKKEITIEFYIFELVQLLNFRFSSVDFCNKFPKKEYFQSKAETFPKIWNQICPKRIFLA